MNISQELLSIITAFKGKPVEADASTSFDELDLDSLDKVDILMQVEEKFDITFDDDLELKTVGELIALIEKLMN